MIVVYNVTRLSQYELKYDDVGRSKQKATRSFINDWRVCLFV